MFRHLLMSGHSKQKDVQQYAAVSDSLPHVFNPTCPLYILQQQQQQGQCFAGFLFVRVYGCVAFAECRELEENCGQHGGRFADRLFASGGVVVPACLCRRERGGSDGTVPGRDAGEEDDGDAGLLISEWHFVFCWRTTHKTPSVN